MSRSGTKSVGLIATLVMAVGLIFTISGIAAYATVTSTLNQQKIEVAEDAAMFAGGRVNTPWEAYAQADVINKHALKIAGGKTYAELPRDDPNRATVMTASFLQASLFTSVLAFGVAAMAVVLGIVLILLGIALKRLDAAPVI